MLLILLIFIMFFYSSYIILKIRVGKMYVFIRLPILSVVFSTVNISKYPLLTFNDKNCSPGKPKNKPVVNPCTDNL